MIFLHIGLIILCFYLLNKVCDEYFINALDRISKRFNISPEAAGTTFMAMASSSPEFSVSLIAVFRSGAHEAIGMGTIVGSALFNLLFVVGASAWVAQQIHLSWQTVLRDTVFYCTVIVLLIVAFWDGQIVLFEAMTFVLLYAVYVFLAIYWRRIVPSENFFYHIEGEVALGWRKISGALMGEVERPWHHPKSIFSFLEHVLDRIFGMLFINQEKYLWGFILSVLFIVFFSWQIVDSAIVLAGILGIPEVVIALTVLGIGASIPDFLTSFIVAKEGRGNMAINNAIGSNIFDILFGLGMPWLLVILIKQQNVFLVREGLYQSVQWLFAFILVFFVVSAVGKWKLGRWSGAFLVLCYVGYLAYEVCKAIGVLS
ncbi:calcium/sodium antiporter [Candidatus Gracilibacteria bacterium]|nr:calcium/sodium antiporter [Candidatus Gracilibacteria bacterium]